jgi:hypothetical protein
LVLQAFGSLCLLDHSIRSNNVNSSSNRGYQEAGVEVKACPRFPQQPVHVLLEEAGNLLLTWSFLGASIFGKK